MKAVRKKREKGGDVKEPLMLDEPGTPPDASSSSEVTCREIAFEACGHTGMLACDFILISCQIGSCCAFAAFIMNDLAQVFDNTEQTKHIILICMTPIFCLLACLRSTQSLEVTSTFGNLCFLFSFIMMLVLGALVSPPSLGKVTPTGLENFPASERGYFNLDKAVAQNGVGGFAQFFGLSIFAFSAHSEIMCIEQFLPPKTMKQYPRVLEVALGLTTCVYIIFGLFGYLFFKQHTQGIIFTNLQCYKSPKDWCEDIYQPSGGHPNCDADTWAPVCDPSRISFATANILSKMVKAAMACMITFNYPFTIFGAIQNIEDIVWPGVMPQDATFVELKRIILRVVCVGFTVTIAATVPDFAFLVGFTGCFSNGLLAFVLPPLFYLQLYKEEIAEHKYSSLVWGANWTLVIFGTCFSVATTVLLCIDTFK
jgi:amino acid permease